jgi:hypothetical protein
MNNRRVNTLLGVAVPAGADGREMCGAKAFA